MEIGLQLGNTRRSVSRSFSTRALRGRWAYYGAAASGLVLHLALALPVYQWYDRLLAWLPLAVFLFLLRQFVLQPYKGIPILVLIALQVYIFFSVPQFSQEALYLAMGEVYTPSPNAVTLAMFLTLGGELAFIFAFQIAGRLTRKLSGGLYQTIETPNMNWVRVAKIYCLIAFLVYMTSALTVSYLPISIRYLTTQLFNVYLALAILLYLGHSFGRRRLVIFADVLAVGMAFVGLLQGMLTAIMGPFVLLFLARWVWGKVFDFRWVVLAVLAILLLNPVKNEFRLLPSWLNQDVSSTNLAQERLRDWSASFQKVWIEGDSDRAVYMSTASRASDLVSFTQAIDLVPDTISYNAGEGMDDAMLFWIPRILWPGKGGGTDLIYNRYALTFGYLDEEDIGKTAVGISVFAEGYWNYGIYGVFGFLIATGLILGTVFGNNGKTGQVSTLVCIVYVAPTILVLQALSVTIASLPTFLIGVAIALRGLSLAARVLSSKTVPASSGVRA
ncbi:MAG TPA: hypothetical protein VGO68_07755 [Pyrinomonadaceae bacterium]|jgi:hypothetical protein|nr:hypothetical protein [Pyrinomonadaceae bacterium]